MAENTRYSIVIVQCFCNRAIALQQSIVATAEILDIVVKAQSTFDHVKSWDFDVMEESRDVLLGYTHTIFGERGLMRAFKISDARLHAFCSEASNRYHDEVPYHNFSHAWAVLHACYMTVSTTAVIDSITLEDTLGLFVGAICHDAGHKGTNNAFHIACHHNDTLIPGLALRYNDVSVLENYHAYQCFNIIQESPDNDIFKSLSPEQFSEVREIIIQVTFILSAWPFTTRLFQGYPGNRHDSPHDAYRGVSREASFSARRQRG